MEFASGSFIISLTGATGEQRLSAFHHVAAKTHSDKSVCACVCAHAQHVVDGCSQDGSAQDGVTPVAG